MNGLPPRAADASISLWAALLSALVASLGSLWLTMRMDLEPCPLCMYQRTCVLCVVGVLVVGLLLRDPAQANVGVMALAVAAVGLCVGLIHVYLEYTGKLECPAGIGGFGSAPQQALAAQAILVFFLLIAARARPVALLVALLLGGLVAWLLFITGPTPKVPTERYPAPPRICRVPYHESK